MPYRPSIAPGEVDITDSSKFTCGLAQSGALDLLPHCCVAIVPWRNFPSHDVLPHTHTVSARIVAISEDSIAGAAGAVCIERASCGGVVTAVGKAVTRAVIGGSDDAVLLLGNDGALEPTERFN
jgi:hypothetical protein